MTLLLAAEREAHRQRLDEAWQCAVAWRERCRAVASCVRDSLAAELAAADVARLSEAETSHRWELVALELEFRDAVIAAPFLALLQRRIAQTNAAANAAPALVRGELGAAASERSSGAVSIGLRVRDSELLRALRAAEARLAQLGEAPFVGLLT
jgi:hypothetical protein